MRHLFALGLCASLSVGTAHADNAICRDSTAISHLYYGKVMVQEMVKGCRLGDLLVIDGSDGVADLCDQGKPVIVVGRRVTCTMGRPRPIR